MLVSRIVGSTAITRTIQSRTFRQAAANLQRAVASVHLTSREDDNQVDRYRKGVPSIISIRSLADTAAGKSSASSNDEHHPTLRERASKRAQQGSRLAKKGAQTFGEMMRQYGPVFVGTYFTVYITTLGSLFLGVNSGLIDPITILTFLKGSAASGSESAQTAQSTVQWVVEWMENHTITKPYAPMMEKNPHFANLAVAWIAIKFTEPVRFGVTLAIVPRLARYFGYVTPKEVEGSDDKDQQSGETEPTGATQLTSEIKESMKTK